MALPSLFKRLFARHIAAPMPAAPPIAPVLLHSQQRWQTGFSCPLSLATVQKLLDQDMLRWLDRQPTYLSPELLLQVEGLLPAKPVPTVFTHEQWVALSHALVTYLIVQQQLGQVPLLAGQEPMVILTHLTTLQHTPRQLLANA